MDREKLLRKRAEVALEMAKAAARLELIDEWLGDPPIAVQPAGAVPVARDPKAARPPAPKRAGTPGPDAAGYADRVAAALLGGPLKVADICGKAGVSYPTADKVLKADPARFLRTGAAVSTRWELTQEGRQAAQARREG